MIYVTVKQSPSYHQMSLDDLLFGAADFRTQVNLNIANTRTYEVEEVSSKLNRNVDIDKLVRKLEQFNTSTEEIRQQPRHDLYYTFYIPKRSGGLRKIDAPEPELMTALRELKDIFEKDFGALYHTNAFAYIKQRSAIDAVKRHQTNESKWFGKYDLSNFFGSTTLDWAMRMFAMVFPFSEVIKREDGEREFRKAMELAFLDGGLPQGTPISPLITNIMMIPVDFRLSKIFRNYNNQHYIYTRYADDFLISSRYDFDFREIEKLIADTLLSFGAPFTIKTAKTRYGSSSGSNWNLGVMLNKDNEITVGYKNKKRFQAMLSSYAMDKKNGIAWDKSDIRTMDGLRSYYHMVEGKTIDKIVAFVSQKHEVDIRALIKADLRA